jgi:LTXXQ motif family protein
MHGGGPSFHGFAGHAMHGPAFAAHAFHGHAFTPHAMHGPRFAGHALHGHGYTAHAIHHGYASHGIHGHGYAAHAIHGHGYAAHAIGHGYAAHGIHGRGYAGHAIGHGAVAGHNQAIGAANRGVRGQLAHNQIGHEQFTHNQFAARNFHGLANYNKVGFNRNAFGHAADWNHWGGHFWGAGWDHWGGGWGGWAGPVFWPYLWGDIFSFAFWPYDYYDSFWAYGPTFIFASIFAPGPYFGLEYGYGPDYYGYDYGGYAYEPDYYGYEGYPNVYYGSYSGGAGYGNGHRPYVDSANSADRQALAETNEAAVQSCSGLAPGVTDFPIQQIRQTVHPTPDQETDLNDLSAAMSQASDIIHASCPSEPPLTPVGRLDNVEQRLDAMIKAIQIVRPPLEKFYESLSDEQRKRFDAMAATTKEGGQPSSAASAGDLTAACRQQSGGAADLPVQRIEQVIQPNAQQQNALDALKKATENAADALQSSCPATIPQSPVARLDVVQTRLNAMMDNVKSIRPALEDFYGSLSDEQKARFNMMGPPPKQTASTQSEHQNGGR